MDNVWAIILAAGTSVRMGKQKLLLPYCGKTIIETVTDKAMTAVDSNVIVVLGSHYDEIYNRLVSKPVRLVRNHSYQNGMLSSVICGFRALPLEAAAALIYLGDQPHIPVSVGIQIITEWEKTKKGIVLPYYSGKRGHPILISSAYRCQIERLDQTKGLRSLLEQNLHDITGVECNSPEILRDIDTPEDYLLEINKIT
jgi:molybdenum cofactor cytidylyltransferase